ncbi:MAG: septum site-determining protein MinD, partial [Clostridium sp.]
ADRIIGKLEAKGLENHELIVNRIRHEMTLKGEMLNIEDMTDILAIKLLGIVPDDEKIVVSTNRGEPAVMDNDSKAGQAYKNIAKRITGEEVPLLNLEEENKGFFTALKKIFSRK